MALQLLAAEADPYISGGAAVLGALVGGTVTGVITYRIEKARREHVDRARQEQHDREERMREKQDRAVAVGLARVLFNDLGRSLAHITTEKDMESWYPPSFSPGLGIEDRKELFRHLTSEEFVAIVHAFQAIDNVNQLRADVFEMHEEPRPPPPEARMTEAQDRINAAANALLRLTV